MTAEPKTMLAMLRYDGLIKQVCVGCTTQLVEFGMVRVVHSRPFHVINEPDGTYCSTLYEIVEPWTLDQCRFAVPAHVGTPWGY